MVDTNTAFGRAGGAEGGISSGGTGGAATAPLKDGTPTGGVIVGGGAVQPAPKPSPGPRQLVTALFTVRGRDNFGGSAFSQEGPASGVIVTVDGKSVSTDSQGKAAVGGLTKRVYTFTIKDPKGRFATMNGSVSPNVAMGNFYHNVTLQPLTPSTGIPQPQTRTYDIDVKVVDGSGQPVAGAKTILDNQSKQTGAKGITQYLIKRDRKNPGAVSYEVQHPSYGTVKGSKTLSTTVSNIITATMRPATTSPNPITPSPAPSQPPVDSNEETVTMEEPKKESSKPSPSKPAGRVDGLELLTAFITYPFRFGQAVTQGNQPPPFIPEEAYND
jgi:hypothetical protein